MAAVDAREPAGIQPVLDLADRQREKYDVSPSNTSVFQGVAVRTATIASTGSSTNETVALDPDMDAARRGGPPAPPRRGGNAPKPSGASSDGAASGAGASASAAEARPVLGFLRQKQQQEPTGDEEKATMATTTANRSGDSAGS